jgi:DNA-binding SARP family transcriptional activator
MEGIGMNLLRVSLFGRFEVWSEGQILAGFESRKVKELFCYLLLFRDRPHPRQCLANLLWNERHTEQPGRCLRKALWQLRSALDSQIESLSNRVLLVESDWIQLNPMACVWLDVAEFEQAFDCAQHRRGRDDGTQDIQKLSDAVALYQGGLRESWYQDWYLYERERFRYMYLIMLDKLIDRCEAKGDWAAGLAFGTLSLVCESARERTHRRMMRLHYLAGDRTAALRQYERCVCALDEELGVTPARHTVALRRQIEKDQFNLLLPTLGTTCQSGHTAPSSWPLLRDRLRELQSTLTAFRREIERDIQALDLAVDGLDLSTHHD